MALLVAPSWPIAGRQELESHVSLSLHRQCSLDTGTKRTPPGCLGLAAIDVNLQSCHGRDSMVHASGRDQRGSLTYGAKQTTVPGLTPVAIR